jgi:hypothetical protein
MRLTYNSYLFTNGFHTVNAILPDRVTGWAVGVAVGLGVLVGRGVAVGPLVVGVGVGVRVALVGVGVGVGVARGVVVPVAVGVLTTMGVHVGVGVIVGACGVVPGTGMTRTIPGRIKDVLSMPLASARALTLTPNSSAISKSVSPALTV